MTFNIPVYRGLDKKDRQRLVEEVSAAYARVTAELQALEETEAGGRPNECRSH